MGTLYRLSYRGMIFFVVRSRFCTYWTKSFKSEFLQNFSFLHYFVPYYVLFSIKRNMKYHQKGQKLGKIFFSEYYYMCKLLFNAGIPMTISWWSPETKKTSRVDQYTEGVDNVENLKGQLSTLKKEIKGSEVPVSPTENIDFGKNKEGQYILQTWDAFITEMDKDVEEIFDEYVKINESRIKELLRKWYSSCLIIWLRQFNCICTSIYRLNMAIF